MSTAKFNQWLNSDGTENYKCRAWVNFNGTGTVAIRASGNVSSITDNGTGDYTVNFTTAMPDTNYSVGGTASVGAVSETSGWWQIITGPSNTALSTTSVRINTPSIATLVVRDTQQAHVQIFR